MPHALETICAPRMLSIVRISAALMLLQHATMKWFSFPVGSGHVPPIFSLIWFAAVVETVTGILALLGLWTRCSAFVLSGHLAVVYWYAQAFGYASSRPPSFFPLANGGEFTALASLVFLYIVCAGPGPWSIDAALAKKPA